MTTEEKNDRMLQLREKFRDIFRLEQEIDEIIYSSTHNDYSHVLIPPSITDLVFQEETVGKAVKPPEKRGECDCGHVGKGRHKGICSVYSGAPKKLNKEKPPEDMSDLKDLHAWECINCGKIVETRQDSIDVPCTSCDGQLVQKF